MKDEELKYGYNSSEYSLFMHYAWRYMLLFSLLYCTIYCTRLNLQNAGAILMEKLGYTKANIGLLTGTLFWSYGVGQLINGRLSDKIGPEKFIILSVIGSVLSNLAMIFQTTLTGMAVVWAVNGLFQSMSWAPGIAILIRWWPSDSRGFATGFTYAFSGFGQALTTLVVTLAYTTFRGMGWKAVFIIPSFFPLAALGIYLLFVKTSPEKIGLAPYADPNEEAVEISTRKNTGEEKQSFFYPFKALLSKPEYDAWAVIVFLDGILRYGLSTWVPVYFIEKYNIDITKGILQSLALPIGMGVGTIVVPTLTDRLCPENRIKAVIAAAAAAGISIWLFSVLDPRIGGQLVLIELLLFVAGFCIYAISGTSGTFASEVGGRTFSGTATSIFSFTAYVGAGVQSLVYGFLLEKSGWDLVFRSIVVFGAIMMIIGIVVSQSNSRKGQSRT